MLINIYKYKYVLCITDDVSHNSEHKISII